MKRWRRIILQSMDGCIEDKDGELYELEVNEIIINMDDAGIVCRGCKNKCKTEGNIVECNDYISKHVKAELPNPKE